MPRAASTKEADAANRRLKPGSLRGRGRSKGHLTFGNGGIPATTFIVANTNTQVGWTAGAGIEYAFAPNWSAKVEYNYVDLGTAFESFQAVGGGTATFQDNIHHTIQIVAIGGNYRF
jgi:outer membrane immunogenic protein